MLIIDNSIFITEFLMFILLTYFITGILVFAKYEDMNPYQKIVYGFVFPIHWAGGSWITASVASKADSIWDNEPFWIGVFILCLLLLASGS
ncbi:hypothetical protein NB063_15870 [Rhodopirellula sp. ICT_H3.1]|uniref:NADH dehydrogenase subunit 4 n=1 Tax=Aporhodopirellula aestuarii TaxID=2950107 RepID=A0ABT0U6Q5_9BACT|nr:hypothetical protein [Aporhodopirellula aestuarii]